MYSVVKYARTAIAAALLSAMVSPAIATDMVEYDGPMDEGPPLHHYTSGPCYLRADVGYSASNDPHVRTVGSFGDISDVDLDGAWMGEVGIGCGSGNRGLRGELAIGLRNGQHLAAGPFAHAAGATTVLQTAVRSHTLMVNGYYDFGSWRQITPYVGAGIGIAYNSFDDIQFAQPGLAMPASDGRDMTLAWSVMAGAGYRLTPRTRIDIGYRYADFGSVHSGGTEIDDLSAHEIKIGVRYHFRVAAPWH